MFFFLGGGGLPLDLPKNLGHTLLQKAKERKIEGKIWKKERNFRKFEGTILKRKEKPQFSFFFSGQVGGG